MVKSSALSGALLYVAALGVGPSQPAKANVIAATTKALHALVFCVQRVMAGSSYRWLPSIVRAQSCMKPMPGDRPTQSRDSCVRRQESRAGLQPRVYTHIG